MKVVAVIKVILMAFGVTVGNFIYTLTLVRNGYELILDSKLLIIVATAILLVNIFITYLKTNNIVKPFFRMQEQNRKLEMINEEAMEKANEKAVQVHDLHNAIISTVADLLGFRDIATGWHVSRTQLYMRALIDQLKTDGVYTDTLNNWDIGYVLQSSELHDAGKISISDTILNKPGKLTSEEYEIMKTHAQKGVEAIEKIESLGRFDYSLEHAKRIAGTHHEKWDGSGYPSGLKGQEIPLEGRIMAIADVYDALVTVRPYKEALPSEEAARIIIEGSGTHFDPKVTEAFKKLQYRFAEIAEYLNDDLLTKMAG